MSQVRQLLLASVLTVAFPAYSADTPAVWLRAASRASRLALRRQNTWIKPGAFGSRSTLGVLVDERSNLLWVCSNDVSVHPRSAIFRGAHES